MYNLLREYDTMYLWFDNLRTVEILLTECEKDPRIRWGGGQNPRYEYQHFLENELVPAYEKLRISCYCDKYFNKNIILMYMYDTEDNMQQALEYDARHNKRGVDVLKQVCKKKYLILNEGDM